MTASDSTATRTTASRTTASATAVAGALAWGGLGTLLLTAPAPPLTVLALVVVGAAALSLAVVDTARCRPASRRTGVVVALLAPFLASAALTPLVALAGPAVLGAIALVVAAECSVLALAAARRR